MRSSLENGMTNTKTICWASRKWHLTELTFKVEGKWKNDLNEKQLIKKVGNKMIYKKSTIKIER